MIRNDQSTSASPSRCLEHTEQTEKIVLYTPGKVAAHHQPRRASAKGGSVYTAKPGIATFIALIEINIKP